ncbi:MAG: hypothetical protein ACRDMV_04510 [Streptosporangiales bacterium]
MESMNFAELNQESVELLPERKALCRWHGGYSSTNLDLVAILGLSLSSNNY